MTTNQITLPFNSAGTIACYGAGVDSTAMLVEMQRQGIRPDVITFADTGGEKPETIEYLDTMNEWLAARDFPSITVCKLATLDSTPYDDLEGNNTANETLPSIAFGMKGCSVKWKQKPQDYAIMGVTKGPNQRPPHPLWIEAKETGKKITKVIGFDSSKADLRRKNSFTKEDKNFRYSFPLQQLGWTRKECIQNIIQAGLPVPIKSACWFCPASQKWELWWLAGTHPKLFMRALHMEMKAMLGRHSRWGADREDETFGKDWEQFINLPADRWPSTTTTVGLGRSFAWGHWARENGIVSRESGNFIADPAHCLAMAERLQKQGGNAADLRQC